MVIVVRVGLQHALGRVLVGEALEGAVELDDHLGLVGGDDLRPCEHLREYVGILIAELDLGSDKGGEWSTQQGVLGNIQVMLTASFC